MLFVICLAIMSCSQNSAPSGVDVGHLLESAMGVFQSQLVSIVQAVRDDALRENEALRFQASICLQAQTLEIQQLQQHLATVLASLSAIDRDYRALQEECRMKDLFISRLKDEVVDLEEKLVPLPKGVLVQSLDGSSSAEVPESAGCNAMSSRHCCFDDSIDSSSSTGSSDSEADTSFSGEESDCHLFDIHVGSVQSSSCVRLVEEVDPPDPVPDDESEDGLNPQLGSDIASDVGDDLNESTDGMEQFLFVKQCIENNDGTFSPDEIESWKTILYEWGFDVLD